MIQITIKFIEAYPPYNKGETATFFEREANRLIDRGFAMYEGGDRSKETAADKLRELKNRSEVKSIPGPAETRHIPGPEETKTENAPKEPIIDDKEPNEENINIVENNPSKVEGTGKKAPSTPRIKSKSGKKGGKSKK
jgi:D-alanyl-D-alanine carboxypeptidase